MVTITVRVCRWYHRMTVMGFRVNRWRGKRASWHLFQVSDGLCGRCVVRFRAENSAAFKIKGDLQT